MALIIRGAEPTNVFQLNGIDENSATYALGWVLEQSPHFRRLVGEAIFGRSLAMDDAVISLQKHGEDGGFTDIEISGGSKFHCVVEAKRSWDVPTEAQLLRYRPRLALGYAFCNNRVVPSSLVRDASMTLPPIRFPRASNDCGWK